MIYEYQSNGACPFCGLRGCGHDRTKYQGPFGIAPKVSAAAPPHAACANEVARPSADETGAITSEAVVAAVNPLAGGGSEEPAPNFGRPHPLEARVQPDAGQVGRVDDPAAYDNPVEPPPTVVPITPKVGVERVLQGIEKRAKRKKAAQGSLF